MRPSRTRRPSLSLGSAPDSRSTTPLSPPTRHSHRTSPRPRPTLSLWPHHPSGLPPLLPSSPTGPTSLTPMTTENSPIPPSSTLLASLCSSSLCTSAAPSSPPSTSLFCSPTGAPTAPSGATARAWARTSRSLAPRVSTDSRSRLAIPAAAPRMLERRCLMRRRTTTSSSSIRLWRRLSGES
ncbi:hypothetical protein BJ508DRAFT_48518 [Ascobolus immersus RN42]|uniref:Uncharacterized protein n=1 Tax=Ascobolus immersus RN42 TaxID=1160509 RepID=A0A3N4HHU8_ASCIM|nr:hypothetical protein BJ508DRAFT_48518 [Ascobolus immersus RN42]